jgi:hypothetical protein
VDTTNPQFDVDAAIEVGKKFLQTLFGVDDWILFRPVETWTEGGKKRSHVIYKSVCYQPLNDSIIAFTLKNQLEVSSAQRANVFFGVCPRFGRRKFDLACQIRKVPALWADVDNKTVDEVLAACDTAKLPAPSIVVNSGNGVHLYWLLDVPFLIDDVGDPQPVETEWTKDRNGRNKSRPFILEDGEKAYLDARPDLKRPSPKAILIQNVVAGIAGAIGADHTTDLSRLLRVPGTLNRKNERNGQEPKPTELVVCDATRRYSLAIFEPFAKPSSEAVRQKKIDAVKLPRVRRLSPTRHDRLGELITACAVAAPGVRSEIDFKLCCFAIRSGAAKDEIWAQVNSIGKFGERGEEYFNRTWENAEYAVRNQMLAKIEADLPPPTPIPSQAPQSAAPLTVAECTGDAVEPSWGDQVESRPRIEIASEVEVGETMQQITATVLGTGCCYNRADQLVLFHGDNLTPILTSPQLIGFLNQYVEFCLIGEGSFEFAPLPTSYANTWLNRPDQIAKLPRISSFTRNPVYGPDWRLTPPGFDKNSGILYVGPAISPVDGTQHLDALLADFCFKTPGDRSNYIAMLLTVILMPHFIGSKPAVLFNANQPGVGKTILAQLLAITRDGAPVGTVSYTSNDEEFEKRLGATIRHGTTTVIIDNAKTTSRTRIDSACLERSITDAILSYRLLGSSSEIRVENSHLFAITANAPHISPDLLSRSVVTNLFHEGVPTRRKFSIDDPEGYAQHHRLELLAELAGLVERWLAAGRPKARAHSRFNKLGWGEIVGGILSFAGYQDFLANAEDAAKELDTTLDDFTELVRGMAKSQQTVWIGSDMATMAVQMGLFGQMLVDCNWKAQATRMGLIASKYINERFAISDDETVYFRRNANSRYTQYQLEPSPNADV